MIECPFCGEKFSEDDLVFEFRWGDIANYFYGKGKLVHEPLKAFNDRTFYINLQYDRRGNPTLKSCSPVINPAKHVGEDPLSGSQNEWTRIVELLSQKNTFEVECDDKCPDIPTYATFVPLRKHRGKQSFTTEGVSTGTFCPFCEQQLKSDVLMAENELRIVLVGRPGSGKTVYVIQLISELIQGRQAAAFTLEPANHAVDEHYSKNQRRLQAFSSGFVMATNPGTTQEPYVYLMSNGKTKIRLIIQDIAGEDTENRIKYNNVVRKADMILFFVDPWHISDVRAFHAKAQDATMPLVEQSTGGKYNSINGIFQQIMDNIDRRFTEQRQQLAGVMLVKGDYLNIPMLSRGSQPECQMMRHPISYSRPDEMEFDMGMRSSFVRQCLNEWSETRVFVRNVESLYSAHNTRYFVVSALGKSTQLRTHESHVSEPTNANLSEPDSQFNPPSGQTQPIQANWNYDEQVLDTAPAPENIIDPVFWCLNRKGIKL